MTLAHPSLSRSIVLLLAASLLASTLLAIGGATRPSTVAAAVTHTLYVDGKHGSDANAGDSWQEALKTINAAARKVPRGPTGPAGT